VVYMPRGADDHAFKVCGHNSLIAILELISVPKNYFKTVRFRAALRPLRARIGPSA
jgi:hypothetical protein